MSEHRDVDAEGRTMSTVPTARHRRFLAQLAHDHYLEGRSKVEIGKAHGPVSYTHLRAHETS